MKNFVTCQECGKEFGLISHTHLKKFHNMTVQEYRVKYPDAEMDSEEVRNTKRMKKLGVPRLDMMGDKNPSCKPGVSEKKLETRHQNNGFKVYELVCETCGKTFTVGFTTREVNKRTKMPQFCSPECFHKAPKPWTQGDLNPMHRPEVAKKVGEGVSRTNKKFYKENPEAGVEKAAHMRSFLPPGWPTQWHAAHPEESARICASMHAANALVNPPSGWSVRGVHCGLFFQSSYECIFIEICRVAGLKLERAFEFGVPYLDTKGAKRSYRPDFYLSEDNKVVEIKGWYSAEVPLKEKAFRESHPDVQYEILYLDDLTKLCEKFGVSMDYEGYEGIEITYRPKGLQLKRKAVNA